MAELQLLVLLLAGIGTAAVAREAWRLHRTTTKFIQALCGCPHRYHPEIGTYETRRGVYGWVCPVCRRMWPEPTDDELAELESEGAPDASG